MKKVLSCLIALTLVLCALIPASAAVSPSATIHDKIIIVDTVPCPPEGGDSTPSVDNSGKVEVTGEEEVTLTATPKDGYKFDHWEFVFGEFVIVSGDLNSPTLVIKPTGDSNIRLNAFFVKDGEEPSTPPTDPVTPPDDGSESPTTGYPMMKYFAAIAIVFAVYGASVVVLRKKYTV